MVSEAKVIPVLRSPAAVRHEWHGADHTASSAAVFISQHCFHGDTLSMMGWVLVDTFHPPVICLVQTGQLCFASFVALDVNLRSTAEHLMQPCVCAGLCP